MWYEVVNKWTRKRKNHPDGSCTSLVNKLQVDEKTS